MRIFVIDDEINILEDMKDTIKEAEPTADLMTFTRGADALEAIEGGIRPDVVFSDIEMPGLSGLALAVRLKEISADIRIIFVTAYREYAIEAFRIKAHGYLLQPLTA